VDLAEVEVPEGGGEEGRDETKLLGGGEGVAVVLRGLDAGVGRMLRGEDRGTAVRAGGVGEMLGEGVGLDWVEAWLGLLVSCPGSVKTPSFLGLSMASMQSAQLEADTNCKGHNTLVRQSDRILLYS